MCQESLLYGVFIVYKTRAMFINLEGIIIQDIHSSTLTIPTDNIFLKIVSFVQDQDSIFSQIQIQFAANKIHEHHMFCSYEWFS